MLICSFTHTHILMTIVGFFGLSLFFCLPSKSRKKNSLVSLISPKIFKKNERKTQWNSVWLSGTTITHRLSLSLSLYHHIQKMTKRAKSRSLRALLMKNELVVRMLIMIIFLAPIGDWLVFHRFFLLVRRIAQKDAERERKENTICF